MMKKLIAIILCIIVSMELPLYISAETQDSENRTERENRYDGNGNIIWYRIFTYDEDGTMISVESYDETGKRTAYVDLSPAGDNIVVTYGGSENTGYVFRVEYTLNEEGERIEHREYRNNELVERTTFETDENGNRTSKTYYKGALYCIREHYIDEDGISTSQTTYTDGSLSIFKEIYSKDGVLIKTVFKHIFSDGRVTGFYGYNTYDNEGREISYDYDLDHNLVSISIQYIDENGDNVYAYYNEQGNLIRVPEGIDAPKTYPVPTEIPDTSDFNGIYYIFALCTLIITITIWFSSKKRISIE